MFSKMRFQMWLHHKSKWRIYDASLKAYLWQKCVYSPIPSNGALHRTYIPTRINFLCYRVDRAQFVRISLGFIDTIFHRLQIGDYSEWQGCNYRSIPQKIRRLRRQKRVLVREECTQPKSQRQPYYDQIAIFYNKGCQLN